MKKITAKEVKRTHSKVYQFGYGELHNLLSFRKPYAYTAGVYGWNADIYSYASTALTVGYRPIGGKVNPAIYKPFETMAGLVIADKTLSLDEKREKVNNLLDKFMEAI